MTLRELKNILDDKCKEGKSNLEIKISIDEEGNQFKSIDEVVPTADEFVGYIIFPIG